MKLNSEQKEAVKEVLGNWIVIKVMKGSTCIYSCDAEIETAWAEENKIWATFKKMEVDSIVNEILEILARR